jgi:hypothetical protein
MKLTLHLTIPFILLFVGCAPTTHYLRSEGIRPGMSMQYLIDTANNTPNCVLPMRRLNETEDHVVYRMNFISGSFVRPYLCTFSNDPTLDSQVLQSIEYDQGYDRRNADAIMMQRNMYQQNFKKMFRPSGQRY